MTKIVKINRKNLILKNPEILSIKYQFHLQLAYANQVHKIVRLWTSNSKKAHKQAIFREVSGD